MVNTNDEMTLAEILVRTNFMVTVTDPNDKEFTRPLAHASGFMVKHSGTEFFVTADHVLHLDDYDVDKRIGKDYNVSIYNNVSPPEQFLSTVVSPLGGFYYIEQFNIEKLEEGSELIDVTLCVIKEINRQYPFLTERVIFNTLTIEAGIPKISIPSEYLTTPDTRNQYFIYGNTRHKIKGLALHRTNTLHEGLQFVQESNGYYLLNTPETITDYDDWGGLSGSPVLDNYGKCIGVFSSVIVGSKSVWVITAERIKMLIDIALSQGNIVPSETIK